LGLYLNLEKQHDKKLMLKSAGFYACGFFCLLCDVIFTNNCKLMILLKKTLISGSDLNKRGYIVDWTTLMGVTFAIDLIRLEKGEIKSIWKEVFIF
jgi:hypothetical protein